MKQTIKITSLLCAVLAAVSVITGITVLTGRGYFVGLSMFSMARQGTFMGYFGNIVGMALTAIGFGKMAFFGLFPSSGTGEKKKAFIWGAVMTGICALSVIFSAAGGRFNFGDVVLLALPAVYTYAMLKSA